MTMTFDARLRSVSILFLVLYVGAAQVLAETGKSRRNDFRPVRHATLSITASEAQRHVDILASEQFQGRKTGTPGQWLAAKYIANEFSEYGLLPVADDSTYYQKFEIMHVDLQRAALALLPEKRGEKPLAFKLKSDFIPTRLTGENNLNAPVVFAGYGITAPEFNYDDYSNIDVRQKIVLVLRHEPREHDPRSIFDGAKLTRHGEMEAKVRNAIRRGALALLMVTDPNSNHVSMAPRGYWPSVHGNGLQRKRWELNTAPELRQFPVIWISDKVANKLLQPHGHSLGRLQRQIDKSMTSHSMALGKRLLHVEVALQKEVHSTQNVIGLFRGNDPILQREAVVVAAHYDHLGVKDGKIFFGADDNASGTAGILEIAEAFTEMMLKPRRSILFIAFAAEEMGLLGSRFYVDHATTSLQDIVSMINLDMISRNQEDNLTIIGSKHSPELHQLTILANTEIGFTLHYDGEQYFDRSDQANFARHDIPVIFYNTQVHADYHRPTDSADKINPNKLARVARLAFLVSWKVANLEDRPSFIRF